MQSQNDITIETRDTVTILHIHGDITVFSEPFLQEAYGKAKQHGTHRLLLNFDENAYINSGGIALLIQLLAEARGLDQKVAITGLSNHYKKIFTMLGITKFAKVYDSIDEATRGIIG